MPHRFVLAGLLALAAPAAGPDPEGQRDASSPEAGIAAEAGPGRFGVLHDDFEGPRPAWSREETDAADLRLLDHERSVRSAHDGRGSERIRFAAGPGSNFYFSYALPKIPLNDGLEASLYLRSDHAGAQLFARVILPEDTDPDTGQPSFLLIPGGLYENEGRWQRLELEDIAREVERRARVLRVRYGRPVKLQGAYLDRLVLNLYGGPGTTEAYLDDLTIQPVPADLAEAEAPEARPVEGPPQPAEVPAEPPAEPDADEPPVLEPPSRGSGRIGFEGQRLDKDGRPWIPLIVRAPGADLRRLREQSFDVLSVDLRDEETARRAVELGFLLMPRLAPEDRAADPAAMVAALAAYPFREHVAFWDLGDDLGGEIDPQARAGELEWARGLISGLKRSRGLPSTLTIGGISGLLEEYSAAPKNLHLVGQHVPGPGSMQEVIEVLGFWTQRRDLTLPKNPNAVLWTWLPATPAPEIRTAVWGDEAPPPWGVPRVQPEQLRMYAFGALSAGFRALGVLGDADLTRGAGRALLTELAFLNAEVHLVESILAREPNVGTLLMTYPPDPQVKLNFDPTGQQSNPGNRQSSQQYKQKEVYPNFSHRVAPVDLGGRRGQLLLVADYAFGAQWQPPQIGYNDVKIIVPNVPASSKAWLLGLGGVEYLEREFYPGGIRISIPNFDGTALILVTTDDALVQYVEQRLTAVRPMACWMAIQQAEAQIQDAAEIDVEMRKAGHPTRDADDLLAQARTILQAARDRLAALDYPTAWSEARRARRPVRYLLRNHFDEAVQDFREVHGFPGEKATYEARLQKNLPQLVLSPVSCPPLVSPNLLPQYYMVWRHWLDERYFGPNLLSGGSFEDFAAMKEAGWADVSVPIDGVTATMDRPDPTDKKGADGRSCLRLRVEPAKGRAPEELPPGLVQPPAAIRSAPVAVGPHQFLRISVKLRMPQAMVSGGGGLFVRDSLGGEPLQFRTTTAIHDWKELILYRRVPAEGTVTVTIGLIGYGEAFIDDLQIRRVEPPRGSAPPAADLARTRPHRLPPRPSPSQPTALAPSRRGPAR